MKSSPDGQHFFDSRCWSIYCITNKYLHLLCIPTISHQKLCSVLWHH